ncbi:P-loop containing nucleoside triphosphate hydrolase protein [Schizopora paradoxa]|uniref:p-loop containing nucleoside triphosphate hydrolase protein n=1 Tax=Schizopora paradoxa TaxID=27342 RepID=A0A0H2RZL7_9AGAM|nr:P-loop containing nucleoside triphosphate hydrolase protein [Schizopora paradoxa]
MFAARQLSKLARAFSRLYIASHGARISLVKPRNLASHPQIRSIHIGNSIIDSETDVSCKVGNSNVIELRPYQESCLQSCMDVLNTGTSRIGVSLPTGSGKTTVFLSLISRMEPPENNHSATRALIIVNSIELATQASNQLKRLFPDLTVEIEQGARCKASGTADVTVATYQTLLRGNRLSKFDPEKLKVVIIDEAHHAAAPSYRRILAHFDGNIRSPDVDFIPPQHAHVIPIVGFSATFSRHDGLALGSVFQRIVYHRDFLDMIKEQWLCNVKFTSVKAQLNLSNVTINTRSGEFNPTSLAHVVNTEVVNRLVVQAWLDRASSRRSCLVFCVNLAHLRDLTATFRNAGIDARYVYAATPAAERKSLIDSFRNGEFPVLLNVGILTEGTDIPNIDCVLVAKPTRSRNLFAQMIGRGMRLSPQTGKTDCHIIDFVDSTSRIPGIVSIPTLFGLDPDEAIADVSPEELEQRAEAAEKADGTSQAQQFGDDIPDPKSVTYIDYENPFALVKDTSGAPHITKLSTYSWVGCGNDKYVLECLGKGHIRIEKEEDESGNSSYIAHFTQAITEQNIGMIGRKASFYRSRRILVAENLTDAVRGCDTYAKSKVCRGPIFMGLFRSAKWRKQPASDNQKSFLEKKFKSRALSTGEIFNMDNLSKGQAADMITRLKHGAHVSCFARV